MKNKLLLPVVMLVSAVATSSFAYRFGNPAKVSGQGKTEVGAVLEFGERELEVERNGASGDVDIRGLYVDAHHGFGNGLELRGRLIPMTLKWDGDNNFDPAILGIGAGLQWVPAGQKGSVRWGIGAAFDYGQGDDAGVDLDYLDITLNGGISVAVQKGLDVYGGLSFINSDVTMDGPGGSVDLEIDTPIGLFGGAEYKVNRNWNLGAELRLMNETMLSLSARYAF